MLLSYQQTLAALIFFCLNIVPFSELSYKWTHSVALWFWFIHVIAFIYSSCFLLTRVSLFGYSRLSDLVIMNEATIGVSFHFLWVIPRSGIAGSYSECIFNSIRNCRSGSRILHSHQQWRTVCFFISLPVLGIIRCFVCLFSHSSKYEVYLFTFNLHLANG